MEISRDMVLCQRMAQIHKEQNLPEDEVFYLGYKLTAFPPDPTEENFNQLIKCLKKVVDFDTDRKSQTEAAEKYGVGINKREFSVICKALADSISITIEELCKSHYFIVPLTHFIGCPKSDADAEDAGGVVAYGSLYEGAIVKHDGISYRAVEEKLEHNDYYTIKCFTLMPL